MERKVLSFFFCIFQNRVFFLLLLLDVVRESERTNKNKNSLPASPGRCPGRASWPCARTLRPGSSPRRRGRQSLRAPRCRRPFPKSPRRRSRRRWRPCRRRRGPRKKERRSSRALPLRSLLAFLFLPSSLPLGAPASLPRPTEDRASGSQRDRRAAGP